MMRTRIVCLAAFLASTLVAAAPAFAEADMITSAVASPAIIDVSQSKLPLSLSVGPLKGELTATSLDALYSSGSSAFVQLKLWSEENKKRGIAANLRIETEHGEIVNIAGADGDRSENGKEYVTRIKGIRKGKSRTVLIEVKLQSAETRSVSKLKFALRPAGKNDGDDEDGGDGAILEQTIALTWPVANCGQAFHSALRKLGEAGGNDLRKSWQAALRPDKSMSRRWLFRPNIPQRSSRRKAQPDDDGISRKEARSVYLRAGELLRAGYPKELRRNGRYGWTISKTANDLRRYFSQDMNPAICTGAIGFAAYYEEKLAPLRKRLETLDKLVGTAEELAAEGAETVLEMTREMSGGHPAWGGAALVALKPYAAAPGDMKSLTLELLRAVNFPQEAVDEAGRADDIYSALEAIDDRGLKGEGMSKALRSELGEALAAIEAGVRLRGFRDRYDEFLQAFSGKLDAIRAAHGEHCVCGS